jgi:hypothetical protein
MNKQPNRIELMKAIVLKMKHADKLSTFNPDAPIGQEQPVKRKRGRPRKDLVAEIENSDNFNFDKLKDDVGIIPTSSIDLHEERQLMGTYIPAPVEHELILE